MKGFVRNIKRKFSTKEGGGGTAGPGSGSPKKSSSSSSAASATGAAADKSGSATGADERKANGAAKSDGAPSASTSSSASSERRKNRKNGVGAAKNGANGGGGGKLTLLTPAVLNAQFSKKDLLVSLPSFRECIAAEKESLLIKKLKMCCVIFDFTDESSQENIGKEMKRQILLELVDYISTTKNWFTESVLVAIIEMISANLFRTLAPQSAQLFDGDEEEPVLDPAWSHLQIVYEFLLRFIVSTDTDAKLVKKSINGPFVLNLLDLFNSEDPRERDYLKTILHRIYGKFMSLRSFVRRSINHTFYRVIYEIDRHNGVGELLEILGSIINGFALPLKVEHKRFLHNVLIPLHKVRSLSTFHQQLAYCISQFIDKDPKVAPAVIEGLLTFWPMTNSSKEVLFLNELEEVLELTQQEEFEQVMGELFKRIALCIGSPHFQVAERALFLWNNEYIAMMTTDNARALLPILYPALHRNSKAHWNATVHSLTFNIIKLFAELDEAMFADCRAAFEEADARRGDEADAQRRRWSGVEGLAKANPRCAAVLAQEEAARLCLPESTSTSSAKEGRTSTSSSSSKDTDRAAAASSSVSSKNISTSVLKAGSSNTEKELVEDDSGGPVGEQKSPSVPGKPGSEGASVSSRDPNSPSGKRDLPSKSAPPHVAPDSESERVASSSSSPSRSDSSPMPLHEHSESSAKGDKPSDALVPRPLSPQESDLPGYIKSNSPSGSPAKPAAQDQEGSSSSSTHSKLSSSAEEPTSPAVTVVGTVVSKAVTLASEKNADDSS